MCIGKAAPSTLEDVFCLSIAYPEKVVGHFRDRPDAKYAVRHRSLALEKKRGKLKKQSLSWRVELRSFE